MRGPLLPLVFLAALFTGAPAAHSERIAIPLANYRCVAPMIDAEAHYHIPDRLLIAIGMVESRHPVFPYPWTLDIRGHPFFARSSGEAARELQRAMRGTDDIDIGCVQVNLGYHGWRFQSPLQLLDPETNVWYGAATLVRLYRRTGSWTEAVALYHASMENRPAQYGYLCRVWTTLKNIRGAATPFGRYYCLAR